jgi:hypothetical protein
MFSSMLLTLLIVPLFYVAIDDFGEFCKALPSRLRGRWRGRHGEAQAGRLA